ncbi:SRPBCC family protein [Nonomuraea sp. H19]|uniref:SRPBCC family protein n=1 Tax=Nonomuraea sp. H19 TaxID=3452206 RepID=UPI003F8CAAE7
MRTRQSDSQTPVEAGSTRARTAAVAGVGAAVGAAVEYLFDPDRGRSRRAKVRDRASHATHELSYGLGRLSRDLNNRTRGVAAGTRFRVTGRFADDRILYERVRAQIGRYLAHPHAVEVKVEDRVARLHGDVLTGEDRRAVRAVRRIPGVKRVEVKWRVHRDPSEVPRFQGLARARQPVPELLQQHWAPSVRFLAGTGAAAMWIFSRRLPRVISWPLRGAGFVLGARAATNLPLRRLTGINAGRRAVDVTRAVSVAAPPERIWPLVSDYSIFARIMPDVREVRRATDGRLSHWEIRGPAGRPIRFDAVETSRQEGSHIAWKSIEGQLIAHTGEVRLAPEEGGKTRVQVQLTYNPVAGATGHAVARLLGADPGTKLREDLLRLKSYIEEQRQPAMGG